MRTHIHVFLKVYRGHTGFVRCLSIEPSGQFFASGGDDGMLKLWEVATTRCMKTLDLGGVIRSLEWNPNKALCLLAVTV